MQVSGLHTLEQQKLSWHGYSQVSPINVGDMTAARGLNCKWKVWKIWRNRTACNSLNTLHAVNFLLISNYLLGCVHWERERERQRGRFQGRYDKLTSRVDAKLERLRLAWLSKFSRWFGRTTDVWGLVAHSIYMFLCEWLLSLQCKFDFFLCRQTLISLWQPWI